MMIVMLFTSFMPQIIRRFSKKSALDYLERDYPRIDESKEKKINFFKAEDEIPDSVRYVIDKLFVKHDFENSYSTFYNIIQSPSDLFEYINNVLKLKSEVEKNINTSFKNIKSYSSKSLFDKMIEYCIENKLITIKNNGLTVSEELLDGFDKFEKFLKYSNTAANNVYSA